MSLLSQLHDFWQNTRSTKPTKNAVSDMFTTGEIVPGERIGAFRLGMSWGELQPLLPASFVQNSYTDTFYASVQPIEFEINYATQQVIKIAVHRQFSGLVGGVIGMNATGDEVVARLGTWVEDEDEGFIIPTIPGISFDVVYNADEDDTWHLCHAPICEISVFRPPRSAIENT